MKRIQLEKRDGMYFPFEKQDEILMQHCVHADLMCLNADGFSLLLRVAQAHGWEVEIV